jgi:hypothetical protein
MTFSNQLLSGGSTNMANDKSKLPLVNPASIQTPEMLADFLVGVGFKSRPVPEEDNRARILHYTKTTSPLQRYLIAQDNEGFQSHAVVSIENDQLCVYYYQMENDLFRVWEVFSGIVEVEKVKNSISSAMTEKEILKRFYS